LRRVVCLVSKGREERSCLRGVIVVGPEEALEDPDRALHVRARQQELPELLLHVVKVSERARDREVCRLY